MQTDRLFQIIYLLLDNKNITAATLAERFGVSTRTIYRDVETLSSCGIPVYMSKGKGGGIRLLDGFVLNKALLSRQEKSELAAALQSVRAVGAGEALDKIGALLGKNNPNWIEVDFSAWYPENREKYHLLKDAILDRSLVQFQYASGRQEQLLRTVEALKLVFKGQSWYLYGFCTLRQDFRFFKLSRIKELELLPRRHTRTAPERILEQTAPIPQPDLISLRLQIDACLAFRVYDEFDPDWIAEDGKGHFIVTVQYPKGEWLFSYLMSFEEHLRVLSPPEMQHDIAKRLENILQNYTNRI